MDNGVPPPNSYQFATDFVKNPGSKAFSFGIAREAYSKVYLKEHPSDAFKKAIPGPGSYKIPTIVGTEGWKFSMRPKTKDPKLKYTCWDAPGPGAYDFKASIN